MTVRALIFVWAGALLAVIGLSVGLATLYPLPAPDSFPPIAVIGSSRMNFAVTERGGGSDSLLGDGRPHLRMAEPRISEHATLLLIEEALDRGAPLIFVEANGLLFDFADMAHQRRCDDWTYPTRLFLAERQSQVTRAVRRWRGLHDDRFYIGDPRPLHNAQKLDPVLLRQFAPVFVWPPCEQARLDGLVRRAKTQGSRIVLLLPPRSPAGDAVLGPAFVTTLVAHAKRLAAHTRLEILFFEDGWRNSEFVDDAHVNAAGRRHFLAEMRRWWKRAG